MPVMQNVLRQQLELERDAAVHKQQLQVDRHAHALQLAQQAHTAAQTESDRLSKKHAQEMELCEVQWQFQLLIIATILSYSQCAESITCNTVCCICMGTTNRLSCCY